MKKIFFILIIFTSFYTNPVATVYPRERLTFAFEDDPRFRNYPDTVISNIVDDVSYYSMYPYYSYFSY